MRFSCLPFITALVLLAMCDTGVAQTRDTGQAPRAGTAIIKGRVLLEGGGPAREATLLLTAMDGSVSSNRRTDNEGRFTFIALPAGRYRLTATPPAGSARHLSQTYRNPDAPVPGIIDLADGATIENVTIRLPRASVISGRVTDEFGDPIAYARITASERLPGGRERAIANAEIRTDDLGRYRFFALRPGEYVVKAEPQRGNADPSRPVLPLTTFHPSTLNPAEAAVVKVGPAQEIADVDIAVIRGTTYTVRGVVLDHTGQPAPQTVNVRLLHVIGQGATDGPAANALANGSFTLRNVPAGEYVLRAFARSQRRPGEFALLPVSVHDNIDNVIVTMAPASTVRGTVSFEGEAPGVISGMRVMVSPADDGPNEGTGANTEVARDGSFVIPNLFGRSVIGATGPRGWYLKSVILDNQDVIGQPIDFRGGEKQIRLVMTQTPASLSGVVVDARGAPTEAAVLVFSEDRAHWSLRSIFTRSDNATVEGKFRIVPLQPGRYLAVALPRDEGASGGAREAFFELLAPLATSFSIGEAEQQTLNLKLVSLRAR